MTRKSLGGHVLPGCSASWVQGTLQAARARRWERGYRQGRATVFLSDEFRKEFETSV